MRTSINDDKIFTRVKPVAVTVTAKTKSQAEIKVVPKTGKPVAAGMLDIIVASWMIIGTWVIFAHEQGPGNFIYAALACILIGLFSMVAGVCAFRRKGWELSLIGSICAIPFIYGIFSTILIIQSRSEFSDL